MSARSQYLGGVKSLVIKLGTQVLNNKDSRLDLDYLANIATQVATLLKQGIRTTIVSSGAVGAGLRELNLAARPTDLAKLQAVAAVGQRKLMDAWADAFESHKLPVAQILLTREDIDARTRFLNLRNTIHAIHEMNAVPIINENDTISTDELVKISFGDNDILAGTVASALRADLLVLLSVVDGILDENGQSVRLVESITGARSLVRTEKSALGKGGMNSKVSAAQMVTDAGECLVVAHGRMENVLLKILAGEETGTLFVPTGKKRSSRYRWIGSARPVGSIVVDDGAAHALAAQNRSLLPAGIVSVDGKFKAGDIVAITAKDGITIARGLTNYSSEEVDQIRGKKTKDVRTTLGDRAYDEVIHRDNMVRG